MREYDYGFLKTRKWHYETIQLMGAVNRHLGRVETMIRSVGEERLEAFIKNSRAESVQATVRMMEAKVRYYSPTRVRRISRGEVEKGRSHTENEAAAYLRTLKQVRETAENRKLDPYWFDGLYRQLMGMPSGGEEYLFKSQQNDITWKEPGNKGIHRFYTVNLWETPESVQRLCGAAEEAMRDETEPLLLIPCVILDFLCIHPFGDANGRISRVLFRYMLCRNGISIGEFASTEKQIEESNAECLQAIVASEQGWSRGANDYEPFIQYTLRVLVRCCEVFEARFLLPEPETGKVSAVEAVRAFVEQQKGKFSAADVIAGCPMVSRASVYNGLKALLKEKSLERIGQGRYRAVAGTCVCLLNIKRDSNEIERVPHPEKRGSV